LNIDDEIVFLDELVDEEPVTRAPKFDLEKQFESLIAQTTIKSGRNAEWGAIASEALGVSHIRADLPCQDSVDYELNQKSCIYGALADGAGSAKFAELGATTAVKSAITSIGSCLRNTINSESNHVDKAVISAFMREEICNGVRADLLELAETNECDLRDLSCTLIAFVILGDRLFAVCIGDSVIVSGAEGEVQVLFEPDKGEYHNETVFLTSSNFAEHAKFETAEGVNFLAVFSDGLVPISIDAASGSPQKAFFSKFESFNRSLMTAHEKNDAKAVNDIESALKSWMQSKDVNSKTDDDKSLLLAARVKQVDSAQKGQA